MNIITKTFSYERAALSGRVGPHAVVVGSGFGGLAAAIRLLARGYRVTVLEKLDAPGGRAYTFRQDGFTFDAGPTIVTAPFLFEELWALCGRRMADDVTLRALDPFYRIQFDDGDVFTYSGKAAQMQAQVHRFEPQDVQGFERFMAASEAIYKVGFERLGDVPFAHFRDMLRIAPEMLRLSSYRSVYGLVSQFFKNPKLRTVFSFHPLLIGGNPFSASSIYALIAFLEARWGVHYAMGGTGELVRGLARLIERQGGEIRYDCEVDEILVQNGKASGVRLRSGEEIGADIVVSNADSAWTYRHMLPAQHRDRWSDRKIEKSRYSMGLFVWYFGTKKQYADVGHHTILLGPRYRALLDDIFSKQKLSSDFSLYLHRPTATDPSMAPDGCDSFYALVPVPNLEAGVDWAEQAEAFRRRIADRLSETLLPGLDDQIVTSRILTPQDFQDRLGAFRGAGFGLEPLLTQSAWFRPHNRSEDVDGLYLVGAGTHPGAGLPGVLSSAKILDKVVPNAATYA